MNERCSRRRYAWNRHPAFRFLASTTLGVILIGVIVAVLAWGTILGARTSDRIALHTVYGAPWFQVILGLFVLNLFCCTLKAMPYRLSKLGFLVTHLSLFLVFAGAILTINFARHGLVIITEGESTPFYLDRGFVRCIDLASDETLDIPTTFEKHAELLRKGYDGVVNASSGTLDGVAVVVDRYYPHATPAGEKGITVTIASSNVRAVLPAVADPAARIPVEGSDWSVTIEKLFYDWKDGQETGDPEHARNPAATLVVHRPEGDVPLTLFAKFPSFSMRAESAPSGFSATYRLVDESPEMLGWEANNSTIHVTVADEKGNSASAWIPYFDRREVSLGARRFAVEYGRRMPLDFVLTLDKFVAKQYAHSNIPAAFESHLTIRNEAGTNRHEVVAMNDPAKAGGFLLYQSSWGTDPDSGRPYTVLSLSRDPGTNVIYCGFATLTAGLIITFYLTPFLRRRERKTREESP